MSEPIVPDMLFRWREIIIMMSVGLKCGCTEIASALTGIACDDARITPYDLTVQEVVRQHTRECDIIREATRRYSELHRDVNSMGGSSL